MKRMSKADRGAWQAARTLADLGELTARWLEGSIGSEPGYCGRPAEETEDLVPVLAKLNRAGFVTSGSQPGLIEPGARGTLAEQRAAVDGFAGPELAFRLARVRPVHHRDQGQWPRLQRVRRTASPPPHPR